MNAFKSNPAAVFPFPVTGCSKLTDGQVCHLEGLGGPVAGAVKIPLSDGDVRVSTTGEAVRFTVVSDGYFDSAGSTVTFRTYELNGDVYLSQTGSATNSALFAFGPVVQLGAYLQWGQQADNLRDSIEGFDR